MKTFSLSRRNGTVTKVAAVALALLLAVPAGLSVADARAGGGFSFGSRGSRSFSMPPSTSTAPRGAQPFGRPDALSPGVGGGAFGSGFGQPRRFGFGSGLAAGLLGAGLFGMLTGHGFFGGLGGISSLFGLMFQLALISGLVMLALRLFRNRAADPAVAGGVRPGFMARTGLGGGPGGGAPQPAGQPITIAEGDFATFERSLTDIQTAYGREDLATVGRLATPTMTRTFADELRSNRSRGVRNELGEVKLLQGDLSEAWREGVTDYATVAMRFNLRDITVELATGRIVDGDPNRPAEATELWTFSRDRGGPWLLSGIQQTH